MQERNERNFKRGMRENERESKNERGSKNEENKKQIKRKWERK